MRKLSLFLFLYLFFILLAGCTPVLNYSSSELGLVLTLALTTFFISGCIFRLTSSSTQPPETSQTEVFTLNSTALSTTTPSPHLTPIIPTQVEKTETFTPTITEVTSTFTATLTPIPMPFFNAARVGKKIMLSFDAPVKIPTPFIINVSVNGVDFPDFEAGLYDSNRPGRIFLIGSWRSKDTVKVVMTIKGTTYSGEIIIPYLFDPIAATASAIGNENEGEGGDTSGGSVTGGPSTGSTTGDADY